MSIELISIGSELLSGHTVNTNASVIGETLLHEGLSVSRVTTISDDQVALQEEVTRSLARASFVIITGGLGPTHDDVTRDALANLFESPLHRDEGIAADLVRRYGPNLVSLDHQATVPTKATIIPNKLGTASGYIFADRVIALPGVPWQMEAMLRQTVIPFLCAHTTERLHTQALYTCLLTENQVELPTHPDVTIGICPSYATVAVYCSSPDKEALAEVVRDLEERYGAFIYSKTDRRLACALQERMVARGATLGCAESCTGGTLASLLTAIPGASDYFLGSIVSYANSVKRSVLGVQEETLSAHGAVSKETVTEMAEGVFRALGSTHAIAVSGIAGPSGGGEEKRVGTVWAAIGKKGEVSTQQFMAKGRDRETIIRFTSMTLMGQLWQQSMN